VFDLQAQPSRGSPTPESDAVRVPPGAQVAGGVGVPHGAGAGRAARLTRAVLGSGAPHPGPTPRLQARYVCAMFWPLIGGFIAFVLVAVILGWLMDTSRRNGAEGDGH
jgi:hypothetical protein